MNKFLFGVATASHQNEGNNLLNNWWQWEHKKKLEKSGIACNSWNEYKKDIDCVKNLGCNAYRFSIEWSRIFPDENKTDDFALERYNNMIDYCLSVEIEPIVTLHHFTRPSWFDNKYGGLHNKNFISFFKKYVRKVCKKFGNKVNYWITFNEPMLECVHGYLRGTRPPGFKGDFGLMYNAIKNILNAHCAAYDIIKKYNKSSMVSISKNMVDFEKQYFYDMLKSKIEDQIIENFNFGFLDAFYTGTLKFGVHLGKLGLNKVKKNELWKGKLDFLGLNHYNVGYVDISYSVKDPINVLMNINSRNYKKNLMGWHIKPESMRNIFEMLNHRYGDIKIMITESGTCERKDNLEGNKLHHLIMDTHLKSVLDYQNETGNIIGYIWWTLVDNFEWDDGWKPKFGLYRLGENLEREMKDSGKKYKEIISNYSFSKL